MNKKQDPRTIQTKALIKQILLNMMKKSVFDKDNCIRVMQNRRNQPWNILFALLRYLGGIGRIGGRSTPRRALQRTLQMFFFSRTLQMSLRYLRQNPYSSEYGVIFFDDSLTSHVIEKIAAQSKRKYIVALTEQLNLTVEQAETIFYFQLNGCLAINKKIYRNGSKNWEASRDLIGGFIQSGLKRYIK